MLLSKHTLKWLGVSVVALVTIFVVVFVTHFGDWKYTSKTAVLDSLQVVFLGGGSLVAPVVFWHPLYFYAMICLCAATYRGRWVGAVLVVMVSLVAAPALFVTRILNAIAANAGDGSGSNLPNDHGLIIPPICAYFVILAIALALKRNSKAYFLFIVAHVLLWIGLWMGFRDFPGPTDHTQIMDVSGKLQSVVVHPKGLEAYRPNVLFAGAVTLFSMPIWMLMIIAKWRKNRKRETATIPILASQPQP